MDSFLVALAFLTVLPVQSRKLPAAEVVARSRLWYPVVGLLLGGVLGGLTGALGDVAPPLVGAFLVVVAWVGITGALHLDGVCDLCDGLFGGATPADRLRIMKDPHVGSFGMAGALLVLLGKFAALTSLVATPRGAWVIAAAVTTARCLILVMAAGSVYPRPDGTGKTVIEATRPWEGRLFTALAAAAVLLALPYTGRPDLSQGALALLLALYAVPVFSVLALKRACRRRLGGITGDCLGGSIELAELVFLLTATFIRRSP